jgi:hypothetical protein
MGIEYFYYPQDYSSRILEAFNKLYPGTYTSCISLYYKKIRKIGFNTPVSSYKSAEIIKDHIITYGAKKRIGQSFNKMWEALKITPP